MSKGYLLFANNTSDVNYIKLAYACALSIKLTQPQGFNNVSIVTNTPTLVQDNLSVFDMIIEYTGPEGMDSRSRAYDYTPYAETICLDSDVLFLNPVDHYWSIMGTRDLFVASTAQNYQGTQFTYGYYRKSFQENRLQDVYSTWMYFKKPSDIAEKFFKTVKLLTDNPKDFITTLSISQLQGSIPTDEAVALSLSILDLEEYATEAHWQFPRITHMKGMSQGWSGYVSDATDKIRFNINSAGQVKFGVWQQHDILHYVEKDLITDSVITLLEAAL